MRLHRTMKTKGLLALALALSGCGAADNGSPPNESEGTATPLAELHQDLTLGSTGPQVRAVHEYLTRYGYFPNEELARSHPVWRAPVPAPAQLATFDQNSADAIRRLQRNAGLEQTGRVDAATREVLARHRCTEPDNIERPDPSDKYAISSSKWASRDVTWSLENTDDVTQSQANSAVQSALETWARASSLRFTILSPSGGANIKIKFAGIDGTPASNNVLAQTNYPADGGRMTIDTAESWSVESPTPSGKLDLQTVVLHEAGHALGLAHSSVGSAVMSPFFTGTNRILGIDDQVAISVLYDFYQKLPGITRQLDVGANGDVWALGTGTVTGGFGIFKGQQSGLVFNWQQSDGAAVRIAVDPFGVPWAISSNGTIWRRNSADVAVPGWTLMPGGCASDIAVGSSGAVWALGCDADSTGATIYRFNFSTSNWEGVPGRLVRITVDGTGRPWGVQANGDIYRRNSPLVSTDGWTKIPGCAREIDIAAGNADLNKGNYPYAVGCDQVPGGGTVWTWDKQADAPGGGPPASATDTWYYVGRNAKSLAVGPALQLWLVTDTGEIFNAVH
jgi:peptidoglycan hydrolase-like protein with peptidoglycan-binding domain